MDNGKDIDTEKAEAIEPVSPPATEESKKTPVIVGKPRPIAQFREESKAASDICNQAKAIKTGAEKNYADVTRKIAQARDEDIRAVKDAADEAIKVDMDAVAELERQLAAAKKTLAQTQKTQNEAIIKVSQAANRKASNAFAEAQKTREQAYQKAADVRKTAKSKVRIILDSTNTTYARAKYDVQDFTGNAVSAVSAFALGAVGSVKGAVSGAKDGGKKGVEIGQKMRPKNKDKGPK